ncbi:MAG: hypothetical protein M1828_003530 [Chrysothrix sp. TS-e1954]|nr:MAG: hypothetical protein M1828_003530 [Chrysothrix sp. TS-e1954]
MPCPSRLISERADPLISPGQISGHVHTISGGNAFALNLDYAEARNSTCSSCPIKEDLSAYWTPKLYMHYAANDSFVQVPQAGDYNGALGGMNVYYEQRPGKVSGTTEKLHAFPAGFRMIAGNPFKRNFTGDLAAKAITFACLDYNGPPTAETHKLPERNCPDGVRVQVYFPSCWNGKDLDSPDHSSHMSYPNSDVPDNGPCPADYPVHLISIFFEVIYQTNQFSQAWSPGVDEQPFVLAMGDPTGYGFHGDFINGWDVPTLQAAVDDCTDLSGDMTICKHFSFFTDSQSSSCKVAPAINENVDGPFKTLPGCNPIQPGPEQATIVQNCPTATPAAASTGLPSSVPNLTSSKGWKYLGCGQDNYDSRTLTGSTENLPNMTPGMCVDYCASKGATYAGVEYSTECYCGTALPNSLAPSAGILGNCDMTCGGNKSLMCGGSGALSIWQKCEGGACANAAYTGPTSGNAKRHQRHLQRHQHA